MQNHIKVLEFDCPSSNQNNRNINSNVNKKKAPVYKQSNKINSNQRPTYNMNMNNNFNMNMQNDLIVNLSNPNKKNNLSNNKPLPYKNPNNNKKNTPSMPSQKSNNPKIQNKKSTKNDLITQDKYEKIPQSNDYDSKNNKAEEDNIVNTIKLISDNRLKYKHTNAILREIGKIARNPVVNFLMQKDGDENDPSSKLSAMLSDKMIEHQKETEQIINNSNQNKKINKPIDPEEEYYNQLNSKIKEEMRTKGHFDFSKLNEKDRKILAKKNVYEKIKNNEYSLNENKVKDDEFDEIEKEIKEIKEKQIKRDEQKKQFFEECEDLEKKEEKINNEKPTARQILENVLSKIEYKNQILVDNNQIEANNKKKSKSNK